MKKILVVDDQPPVRELLKVTLEIDDYQVLIAEDGWQAMAIARAENPAVILLDIMMSNSDLDGLEVCRRLKTDPATSDITVILLSAKGRREDIEAGIAAGADDYVVKPFSPVALLQRIDRELDADNGRAIVHRPVPAWSW